MDDADRVDTTDERRTSWWRRPPRTAIPALLLSVSLVHPGADAAPPAPLCLAESGGASACDAPDGGSSRAPGSGARHVGNPVDVVSGNKYLRDDDYRALGSPLGFARHYNSSLGEHDTGLGAGWRHTWQVVLSRLSENRLAVVQGDGRRIEFERRPDEPARYLAVTPGDGEIALDGDAVWSLPDGRALAFRGSFLVRVTDAEDRPLRLFYRERRLRTVTDHHGRVLELLYTPGRVAPLDEYEPRTDVERPGHLAAIRLPDGTSVRYRYDGRDSLTRVEHAGRVLQRYGYENPDFPHHLTRREADDVRAWGYDEAGRGASFALDGRSLLAIDFGGTEPGAAEGATEVRRPGGEVTRYRWHERGEGSPGSILSVTTSDRSTDAPSNEDPGREGLHRER